MKTWIKADTKESARVFVENGGKTYYRYGFAYRGAGKRPISKEDALLKLDKVGWSFGKGFYELCWEKDSEGNDILVFNEYSEGDMW